jgi:Acetyltransferase (GNAT) family
MAGAKVADPVSAASDCAASTSSSKADDTPITYRQVGHVILAYDSGASTPLRQACPPAQYKDEHDLALVMELIDKDLSEPYSIFTYRYFLEQWPHLCFLAFSGPNPCGVIVCKMDMHREHMRGYLAMLVVDNQYRGKKIGAHPPAYTTHMQANR